jgi:predicted transport protein
VILNLDEAVEEAPRKLYVAYKKAQNFVCVEFHKKKITLYLKLDPGQFKPMPKNSRDVSNIGHYGTGNFEYEIMANQDLSEAKELIKKAFEEVGG